MGDCCLGSSFWSVADRADGGVFDPRLAPRVFSCCSIWTNSIFMTVFWTIGESRSKCIVGNFTLAFCFALSKIGASIFFSEVYLSEILILVAGPVKTFDFSKAFSVSFGFLVGDDDCLKGYPCLLFLFLDASI